MRKLSIVLTVLLSVLLAFVACDNSIDIGLNTKVEVKEIRLNKTELDISTGEEATLVATVLPEDATDKSVTWSSSDPKVAKVDANGKVTGVGDGEATITVTSNSDNTVYETCSVKVTFDPYKIPLTLEFINAGEFWINYKDNYDLSLVEYSLNGQAKRELEDEQHVEVSAGDKICFYRNYEEDAKAIIIPFKIVCDSECYVYGNVMSLIDSDGFAEAKEVPSGSLLGLFAGNTCIKNHDTYDLVLPAKTLAASCYAFMFAGCNKLERAPELPATQLAYRCYESMFSGCSNLTTAPVLPAKTLADHCYYYMFNGCSSLNSITCLATDISAPECTTNWVSGVASTGTFTRHPLGIEWETGSNGIPSTWSQKVYGQDIPLTFKFSAASDNAFTIINPSSSLAYSINGGDLIDYSSQSISVNAGDEVSFYAIGTESTSSAPMVINCNEDCILYGNAMSLISKTDFKNLYFLSDTYVFSSLFSGNAHLKSADGLVLPAAILTNGCYAYMFNGCTSLTKAPALPAATLENQSYWCMFKNCTSLTSITCLATNIDADDCVYDWVYGINTTGSFYTKDAPGFWVKGTNVPSNWTIYPQ